MSKTGKSEQTEFENHWKAVGKAAFNYRMVDAAEVRGRTKKAGFTRRAPADYIVTHAGQTFYAEVKSCNEPVSFPFAQIDQKSFAEMITIAGGQYWLFIKSTLYGNWYKVPYSVVQSSQKKSIRWSELADFVWTPKKL